ncbi:DUF975 family protein [Streptococcus catagoni]|uniref:DUF975 family protein n=1 Tax=Streptococcus catagoni TaxID=2654874 RepID=UPI00140A1CBC|nr:DUF975 family protein [Streptococcus catagoni]
MKSRAELKKEAKAALKGNWKWAILVTIVPTFVLAVIYVILSGILSWSGVDLDAERMNPLAISLTVILYLLFGLLEIGLATGVYKASIDLIRNQKKGAKETIFYGFKEGRYSKFFILNLLIAIFVYLWSLLLVIPGMIKSYSYAQSFYVLIDRLEAGLETSATEPITKSRHLMNGYKWKFFVLELSFIGWIILTVLTFGIGFIWLYPYMLVTSAAFYEDLLVDQGLNSVVENLQTQPEEAEVRTEKEDIISDVPLMGQPEINDATLK